MKKELFDNDVVVISTARTAIGKIGGMFVNVEPDILAKFVLEEAIKRANIDKSLIEEVIIGQCKQSADQSNIARVAALRAGIPIKVPAYTVMRQCGSGLQTVLNAYQVIKSGMGDIVLVGGTESMSNAPYYLRGGGVRFGLKAGNSILLDSNTEGQAGAQPQEIYGRFTMGETAERLADKYSITREEMDIFAYNSQIKAMNAMNAGKFKDEIVPVSVKDRKGNVAFYDTDEGPRETSIEKLGKLKPVFRDDGRVTAGNSSTRNDAAAALILMSAKKAKEFELTPLCKIVSAAVVGVEPGIMGIGPVPSTIKVLKMAGMKLEDIELIELNEAFAAQALSVIKALGLNQDIVNVNGGAIALGHPLGATGARILITLIHELKKRNQLYGLATLCMGGGQGMSLIVENLQY